MRINIDKESDLEFAKDAIVEKWTERAERHHSRNNFIRYFVSGESFLSSANIPQQYFERDPRSNSEIYSHKFTPTKNKYTGCLYYIFYSRNRLSSVNIFIKI